MEKFEKKRKSIEKCLLQAEDSYTICQNLSKLSDLITEQDPNFLESIKPEIQLIIKKFRDFSHYNDPRVRSNALLALINLHQSGIELDISLYGEFCVLLNDEYEKTRITAMRLIQLISCQYKTCLSSSNDIERPIVDDAFEKICSMMCDCSINVRVHAAQLLGKFSNISLNFLHQTLDKTLMSDLKRKKSAHQRQRETLEAGEWNSNRKWTDDAPSESLFPETIKLMNSGSCGAFIHGLEDEYSDVRMASLESICNLAMNNPTFANQSLDFLVDMFNDEIEQIRLQAIKCLTKISSKNITLRKDQIDIILAVLEDYSSDIREELHLMLSKCKLASTDAIRSTIECLLENLSRYPSDKESIWKCFQNLGRNNPFLIAALVNELITIHPFFKQTEKTLNDPEYTAILILIFNAAEKCPPIQAILETAQKHYVYLKISYPNLVPFLHYLENDLSHTFSTNENFDILFQKIISLHNPIFLKDEFVDFQIKILADAINDIENILHLHESIKSVCTFFSTYLQCQISFRKIISNTNWINTYASQSNMYRSLFKQLLNSTFILLNAFHGLEESNIISLQQTRINAMALQLIAVIHGSNVSALGLCEAFLSEIELLKKLCDKHKIKPSKFTAIMCESISKLDQPRPGNVARSLEPIFRNESLSTICDLAILQQITPQQFTKITMTRAEIVEPKYNSETSLIFTAGLIGEIPLIANVEYVHDITNIRIQVQYPDYQIQTIQPKSNEFRLKYSHDNNIKDYKLMTKIFVSSNGVWSKASFVEISIILDFRDVCPSSLSNAQIYSSLLNKNNVKSGDNFIIEICKPIRVMIQPTKPKKFVI